MTVDKPKQAVLEDEKARCAKIGTVIAEKRLERKIPQEELAKILGIDGETLRRNESGETRISAGRVSQIAENFAEPIEEFFPDIGFAPSAEEMSTMVATNFKKIKSRTMQRSVLNIITHIARRGDSK